MFEGYESFYRYFVYFFTIMRMAALTTSTVTVARKFAAVLISLRIIDHTFYNISIVL